MGPFKIIKQITPVSYRLALPPQYCISPTFHVSLLKAAGALRRVDDLDEARNQGPPPLIIDGEEAYQVQEILDSQLGVVLQYLVDWKGPGSMPRTFLTHHLPLTFPAPIRTNRPLVLVEDPSVGCLLTSGAARRGGSVTNQASVVPPDHHQRPPSPEY